MPIVFLLVLPELLAISEPAPPQQAQSSSATLSDSELVHKAETTRTRALTLREQPNQAWPQLQEAMKAYEELHRRGIRNPTLYLHLGNLYFISGRAGDAVFSFRRGLQLAPAHPLLRSNLNLARQQVLYHKNTGCGRPPIDSRPPWLPRFQMADWMLIVIWLAFLACCVCATRAWMKRDRRLWIVGGAGFALVLLVGGLMVVLDHYDRPDSEHPFLVIRKEGSSEKPLLLRLGNGARYPTTSSIPLRQGMEGELLTKRGGWVQMKLASGEVGWVPEESVLIAE